MVLSNRICPRCGSTAQLQDPSLPLVACLCGWRRTPSLAEQYAAHESQHHEYTPDCPGCRPVLLDGVTGMPLGSEHPLMKIAAKVWDQVCSLEQKRACIRVWVHNSRAPGDLRLCDQVMEMFSKECAAS